MHDQPKAMRSVFTTAVFPIFLLIAACSDQPSRNGGDSGQTPEAGERAPQSAFAKEWRPTYVAPDHANYATTPAEQQALQAEIDSKELSELRKHGWKLWGAITARTDETYEPGEKSCGLQDKLATFDTWYGQEEIFRTPIFCPDGKPCGEGKIPSHFWHTPRQAGGAQVLSFNKYSTEFVDWVDENTLYEPATLENWNDELTRQGVPTEERSVNHFINPPSAVATMLKPTFWVLKRDTPMMMPYWYGPLHPVSPENSATLRHPVVSTWKNYVLYDPTGKADPSKPREVTIYGLDGPEKHMVVPKKVVTLDDFYSLPLTAEDVEFIQGANIFTIGGIDVTEIKPCDVVVLVGMHVTTAEVENWTWQTFYWNPFPSDPLQPSVDGPFKNFDLATAYFFDGANGKPHIAYNPYLEPPITGPTFMNPITMYGADSNCMSCHHAAAFPTLNGSTNPGVMLQGSYFSKGAVSGAEQWFNNRIKTTFMWGLLMSMQGKSGSGVDEGADDQQ